MSRTSGLTTPSRCETCGAEHEAVTSYHHEGAPKPGDLTVCLYCGELFQFGPMLEQRRIAIATLSEENQKTVEQIRAQIKEARRDA